MIAARHRSFGTGDNGYGASLGYRQQAKPQPPGPVPLGYRCTGKKPVIVPRKADTVRLIFTRYRELGSVGALLAALLLGDARIIAKCHRRLSRENRRLEGQKRKHICGLSTSSRSLLSS